MMIRLISLRLCAMLMLHCRKDVLSLWEHLIQLLIFLLCGSWLKRLKLPIAGKDFKTGQTLVKSGFAPIIGTRCLGLDGWFSTNILGNRDGLVLDEPANFHTKEVSKLSTLESILVPEDQPDLYTDYYHKVRINYYTAS